MPLNRQVQFWLAMMPRSQWLLLGHFLAFFLAASQLRMDSVLAAAQSALGRAASLDTPAAAGGDDDEDQGINGDGDQAGVGGVGSVVGPPPPRLPRVTPTQVALLPHCLGDTTVLSR
jgi:hypothetical protein